MSALALKHGLLCIGLTTLDISARPVDALPPNDTPPPGPLPHPPLLPRRRGKAAANKPDLFAQFQVIGEYLRVVRPDLVHVVFCPLVVDLKDHPGTFCTRYAAPGVHYAWR